LKIDGGDRKCHDRNSPDLPGGGRVLRCIIAALTAAVAAPVFAADSITWLTSDLPPHYIAEGELAGQGIKDRQLQLIAAQIPEFQHRTVRASISRLWYQIRHEDGMCGIGALRNPEREKIAVFSRRPVLARPRRFRRGARRRAGTLKGSGPTR